ncbi:MAG: DUF4430 domain-containing protein [Oscillospiraceae bacterium]|nr:DUF4430 domain-containing protein [Oscillospiraceae bacterium]
MAQKKNNRKILIIAGVCLAILVAAFAVIYGVFMPKGQAGDKTIGITVVFAEDNQKEYTIQTDAENLGDALTEKKLVEGTMGEYGLYIETVDGVTADSANQEWWCITKDGEMLNTGADATPIADGEHYELTLSKW